MSEEAQTILLIGGGHAHVQVIKGLHRRHKPNFIKVILVDWNETAFYSGMMPGCIAQLYTREETHIQLRPLAKWAGIEYKQDAATAIDTVNKKVRMITGRWISYDVVSIDIGSRTLGTDSVPGVKDYAITTRPINALLGKLMTAERRYQDSSAPVKVVVVGAGAAGVELALTVKARWAPLFDTEVTVLCAGEALLDTMPDQVQAELVRQMRSHGISWKVNSRVVKVEEHSATTASGEVIAFDEIIWATGAEARPIESNGDAELSLVSGFVEVNEYLQSTSSEWVFGGGDCVHMTSAPMPKAGVYAVRAGPILLHNLVAKLLGRKLQAYTPQHDFLRLLCLGDGTAIGAKFGVPFYGAWVWALKDLIDRAFMKLFDPAHLPTDKELDEAADRAVMQYDAEFAESKEVVEAGEAARLLAVRDAPGEGGALVDCSAQHKVLKRMAKDEEYCAAVLKAYQVHLAELTAAEAEAEPGAGAGAGVVGSGEAEGKDVSA